MRRRNLGNSFRDSQSLLENSFVEDDVTAGAFEGHLVHVTSRQSLTTNQSLFCRLELGRIVGWPSNRPIGSDAPSKVWLLAGLTAVEKQSSRGLMLRTSTERVDLLAPNTEERDQWVSSIGGQLSAGFAESAMSSAGSTALLCIHYAGGDATAFHSWQDALPSSSAIEVVALDMPGHGSKRATPPCNTMESLVAQLVEEALLRVGPKRRFALVGYSFGAAVAFELAHALVRRGRVPAHFFAVSAVPPSLAVPAADPALSDTDLASTLLAQGILSSQIVGVDDAMLAVMLAPYRADLAIEQQYYSQYRASREAKAIDPLPCPISVLSGEGDEELNGTLQRAGGEPRRLWQRFSSSGVASCVQFCGGHLFTEQWLGGKRQVTTALDRLGQVIADVMAGHAVRTSDLGSDHVSIDMMVESRGFWRRLLGSASASLLVNVLPLTRSSARDQTQCPSRLDGRTHSDAIVRLSTPAAALSSICSEAAVSPAAVAYCAWAICLSRFTREMEVAFGVRKCGQALTVPLVVSLPEDANGSCSVAVARDVVHRVYEEALQYWPDQALLKNVGWNGDVHSVVCFADDRDADSQAEQAFPAPLVMIVSQNLSQNVLQLKIQYDRSVYAVGAINAIGSVFDSILRGVVAGPGSGTAISTLNTLSLDRRHVVLGEWNRTGGHAIEGLDLCMHQLFEKQARQAGQGDRVAVRSDTEEITYSTLDASSDALAVRLQDMGCKPETAVGILVPPSTSTYISILGIQKAGGYYVPMDVGYPHERLRFMMSDASMRVVVTTRHALESSLAGFFDEKGTPQVVCVDEFSAAPTAATRPRPSGVTGSNAAYAIYTSGSTGKPKGVLIEHKMAVNTCLDINRRFDVTHEDSAIAVAALTFDLSVWDWCGTFAAGACLVVPERGPGGAPDPSLWHRAMVDSGVTIWNSAPPVMSMLMEDLLGRGTVLPPTLRLCLLSGDWIPTSLPDKMKQMVPDTLRVVSLGGATEASIWSNYFEIHGVDPMWPSIPYGRPLSNQCFFILDDNMQPVAPGVVGQLCIGGLGVAREYLNRGELSRRKFVGHSFDEHLESESKARGCKMYLTGDLGRWMHDGVMEFIGRMDFQVKIRGFRVELGEIEAAMNKCGGDLVTRSVCLAASGQLYGFCVLRAGAPLDGICTKRMKDQLATTLTSYMVPGSITVLHSLPLTQNGKVDRKALLAFVASSNITRQDAGTSSGGEIELQSKLEHSVFASIPEEIAGALTRDTDFFEAGMTSLQMMSLVTKLRGIVGPSLPVSIVVQHPTFDSLCSALASYGDVMDDDNNGAVISPAAKRSLRPPSNAATLCQAFAQFICLYLMMVCSTFSLFWAFMLVYWARNSTKNGQHLSFYENFWPHGQDHEYYRYINVFVALPFAICIGLFFFLLTPVAAKWLVLGRVHEGDHKVGSAYFIRWWFVDRYLRYTQMWALGYFHGTPIMNVYFMLLGVDVGMDVNLHTHQLVDPDLITIGDCTTLGAAALLVGHRIVVLPSGEQVLRLRRVRVGRNCALGDQAVMTAGDVLPDNCVLGGFQSPSAAKPPMRRVGQQRPRELVHIILWWVGVWVGLVFVFAILSLSAYVAGRVFYAALHSAYDNGLSSHPIGAAILSLIPAFYVFGFVLLSLAVTCKWFLVGRVPNGSRHHPASWWAYRKWLVERLLILCDGTFTRFIHTSAFFAMFMRALGMKVGNCAMFMFWNDPTADLDLVSVGSYNILAGFLQMRATRPSPDGNSLISERIDIGDNCFIANCCTVESGAKVPSKTVIGTLTCAQREQTYSSERAFLGDSNFRVPMAKCTNLGMRSSPFRRFMIHVGHVLYYTCLPANFGLLGFFSMWLYARIAKDSVRDHLYDEFIFWVVGFPMQYVVSGFFWMFSVVFWKWALLGKVVAHEHMFFSHYVLRWNLFYNQIWSMCQGLFAILTQGSPFYNWFLQGLGMHVGAGAYVETERLEDFDKLSIGINSYLGTHSVQIAHTFEGGKLRIGEPVEIGDNCSIGPNSVLLPGVTIGSDVSFKGMTIGMHNEPFASSTRWEGVPARACAEDFENVPATQASTPLDSGGLNKPLLGDQSENRLTELEMSGAQL